MRVLAFLHSALLLGSGPAARELPPRPVGLDPGPVSAIEASPAPPFTCELPLAWRVGEIDPRFAINRDELEETIRTATYLWEDRASRRLFTHDPEGGFPINLVFDHRQALAAAMTQGTEALQGILDRLERWRADLGVHGIDLNQRRDDYQERLRSLDRQVESHNRLVSGWNEQGGAPREEAERLAAIGERFQDERRTLNRMAEELNQEASALARETEALNQAIRDYNRSVAEHQASPSIGPVESGLYREEVQTRNGVVVVVEREIRVFQFSNPDHLLFVLAHELGHALGLKHSSLANSIMYPSTVSTALGPVELAVDASDVEALRGVCPPP